MKTVQFCYVMALITFIGFMACNNGGGTTGPDPVPEFQDDTRLVTFGAGGEKEVSYKVGNAQCQIL